MLELVDPLLNIIGVVSPILFLLILGTGFVFSIQSARIFVSGIDASRADSFSSFETLREYLANGDPETTDGQIPAL